MLRVGCFARYFLSRYAMLLFHMPCPSGDAIGARHTIADAIRYYDATLFHYARFRHIDTPDYECLMLLLLRHADAIDAYAFDDYAFDTLISMITLSGCYAISLRC